RLGEVAQQGRRPRHHGVGVEAFMKVQAILEDQTLLGKLSGLRKCSARLRATGECVKRSAAKPGVVEALGDRQAASRTGLGFGDVRRRCLRPSPERVEPVRDQEARDGLLVTGPGDELPPVGAELPDLLLGRPVPHRPLTPCVPREETAEDAQLLVGRPSQLPAEPERDPGGLRPFVSPGPVTATLLSLTDTVWARARQVRAGKCRAASAVAAPAAATSPARLSQLTALRRISITSSCALLVTLVRVGPPRK